MSATQPEPTKYEWRPGDRDADVFAILACALSRDHDSAVHLLATLSNKQTVSLVWALSWFADELGQQLEDPVSEIRRLALVHGRRRAS